MKTQTATAQTAQTTATKTAAPFCGRMDEVRAARDAVERATKTGADAATLQRLRKNLLDLEIKYCATTEAYALIVAQAPRPRKSELDF